MRSDPESHTIFLSSDQMHYHPPERSSSATHADPSLSLVPLQSVPSEVPDTSDAGINYRIYTDYMSIQP